MFSINFSLGTLNIDLEKVRWRLVVRRYKDPYVLLEAPPDGVNLDKDTFRKIRRSSPKALFNQEYEVTIHQVSDDGTLILKIRNFSIDSDGKITILRGPRRF